MRNFWRATTLSLSVFMVSKQWGDMEQVMPAFLERNFGEDVPYYRINSINLWMCLVFPPIVAATTSHIETFKVMLPGLWVMALSPIFLALRPTVESSVLWVIFLSLGEVFWSPRLTPWAATLAPTGREGVFFAVLGLKNLLVSIPSTAFNGWLNEAFNPNCPSCRDEIGHFCSELGNVSCASQAFQCVGERFSPALLFNASSDGTTVCPSTCLDCPGWRGYGQQLWFIILVSSVSSPFLVTLFLPFLRSEGARQRQATSRSPSETLPAPREVSSP